MKWLPFAWLPLILLSIGQGEEAKPASEEFFYRISRHELLPNVELPEQVVAAAGKLTLFADFDNRTDEGLPLYIVNRSGEPVSLSAQDSDLYIRLEFLSGDGVWKRAQLHRNAWCGNSYYSKELKPGMHFVYLGYSPKEGTKAKVRYRSQSNELISNVGKGFYLQEDFLASEVDDMARANLPGPLAWVLQSGDDFPYDIERTPALYLKALELASIYTDSRFLREEAQKMIKKWSDKPDLTTEIQSILDRDWPTNEKRTNALLEACLEGIRNGEHSAFLWRVIESQVSRRRWLEFPPSREVLSQIYEAIPASAAKGQADAMPFLHDLIEASELTSEFLSTKQLLEWLHSEDRLLFSGTCDQLALRGKFAELVEIGNSLEDASRRSRILESLASRGEPYSRNNIPRRPSDDNEVAFWEKTVAGDPIQATRGLRYRSDRTNPYPSFVYTAVRNYFVSLIKEMPMEPTENEELYELDQLVQFFADFQKPGDIFILKALLRHPEYEQFEVSSSQFGEFTKRSYRIRETARRELVKRGISVSNEIIFEERIPKTEKPTSTPVPEDNTKPDPFG